MSVDAPPYGNWYGLYVRSAEQTPNSRKDRFFKGDDKTVGASIARPLLLRAIIKADRGEHRSSADFFGEQLLKQVGASIARPRTANGSPYFLISLIFFQVDHLPEQTIVRHDFVLLIRRLRRHLLRWRRLFVAANYFVQLSKLKFNDIFTCVR